MNHFAQYEFSALRTYIFYKHRMLNSNLTKMIAVPITKHNMITTRRRRREQTARISSIYLDYNTNTQRYYYF